MVDVPKIMTMSKGGATNLKVGGGRGLNVLEGGGSIQ